MADETWKPSGVGKCGCGAGLPRRRFMKLAGAAAASALAPHPLPAMAGPFDDVNEYLQVIPEDKRLAASWISSLHHRGEKETYSDPQSLRHIAVPVGGLFAGTLYLGGDGRLWLWDVFNQDQEGIVPRTENYQGSQLITRNGANYVAPAAPQSPFQQGFAIRVGEKLRTLDQRGFAHITFDGRYPIARVDYRDDECPVSVQLEAFSPFIPLHVADSSLPAVILNYTVTNRSTKPVTCQLLSWLENPVVLHHRGTASGRLVNRVIRERNLTMLVCSATEETPPTEQPAEVRADIVFADFESDRYDGWTVEGEAFGKGPVAASKIPSYQGDVGGQGRRVVNSHASAPGGNVREKDDKTGILLSEPFPIRRRYIHFLIGGGNHPGETCLNLLIGDDVVASATGRNDNRMAPASFFAARLQGKTARLQILDRRQGGWGNIGVDHIVFSDRPPGGGELKLTELPDFGTMALALLGDGESVQASADSGPPHPSPLPPPKDCGGRGDLDARSLARGKQTHAGPLPSAKDGRGTGGFIRAGLEQCLDEQTKPLQESLVGAVSREFSLEPGQSQTATFVAAWHFPNFYSRGAAFPGRPGRGGDGRGPKVGHSYAARFADAPAVARYVAVQFDRLAGQTRTWVETWYDSTLPYWLLDRTMANTSTLATATCYRFQDGRFWAWEGIGCCPGTCTHVWHYAQAPGRLFPEIEREHRRRVDFGVSLHEDGGIGMRAGLERANEPAHDGQCGRILGAYREHQMSADSGFLRELWPKIKRALQFMIQQDANADGMVEGAQPNTLDAAWYGKISFLASLYLAALRAGEAMAAEMEDQPFARQCREIADRGARSILQLHNGEYFQQIEDPQHAEDIGVGPGCYIDQVFGQTWAHWVGLGCLFDRDKQLSALRALWKYNFVPDVGPFRERFQRGRWYAVAGDAGLLMCTWPKGGQNPNFHKHWQYQYFNECMTGFEWQAAAHMIWEGHDQPDLLEHGLAVARAIHDRYNAALRNPYNEIECSDHYARAMASYGAYQAVCGFEHHGPKGHIGLAPRLSPDNFRGAFTAAGGWGSFQQQRSDATHVARLELKWGQLRLESLALHTRPGFQPRAAAVSVDGKEAECELHLDGSRALIALANPVRLQGGQTLEAVLRR